MGFLDRVAAGAEFRSLAGAETRSLTSGLRSPSSWLVDAFSTGRTSSGQRVTAESSLGVAAVWAAVTMIAETVGGLPLKVFKDQFNETEELNETITVPNHRAYGMLHDKPNSLQPANRFWSTVTAHLLLWGNAFIEKTRGLDTGLVEELWLLDPRTMTVQWDSGRRVKTYVQHTVQGERRWSDDEVLHILGFSLDGLIGESVISRARQPFGTAIARDEFEGSFYGNGAVLSGLVQHPNTIGAEAIRNLRESIHGVYGGSKNAGRVAVLEEGATWNTMSAPLRDLAFVESQQLSATQIATMFHIPPAFLGGSTGDPLTYHTVESNNIQFAQHAISPWSTTIAKAVAADRSIFPYPAFYPEFVLEELMRGDHKSRAEFYAAMFGLVDGDGRRAMGVDEIRARENLPPAPRETVPPPTPPPPAADGNGNGNGNGSVADRFQQIMRAANTP